MKKEILLRFFLLKVIIFIVYLPVFIWMYERWTAKDTYYSHGILVPFISAYLIWRIRDELKNVTFTSDDRGWIFFILGIIIFIVSAFWQVYFSAGFSLLAVFAGLILIFLGKEFLLKILFPLIFLSFMIPLPMVAIANISFRLKILAAQLAVSVVRFIGIPAQREGSIIRTAHSYLVIEDPCSGIRSLIALIALGALMAYLSKLSYRKKILLFISSLPISILANVFRIVILTAVSEIYGVRFATGRFHDIMGIVVFIFAFLALNLLRNLFE
ncbi:MAG: exosortase/archaeosortase family protein [Candidatus Omnitrophica bacterium]|nr:exosortase/archaeosortase family protein [Candidatus Omnitrophota bacterium]